MKYDHTQHAPLYLILLGTAIVILIGGAVSGEWIVHLSLLATGSLILVLSFCFCHLNICDRGDRLVLRFGPLPLFTRNIKYADMEFVERGRTTVLDGWGIHWSPGWWTWNLWGFDCVEVRCSRGRNVRVGTNDPDGLEAFLKQRLQQERHNTH